MLQLEVGFDPTHPGAHLGIAAEVDTGLMNNHLQSRRYFTGGRLSLADIALVAYTRFAHQAAIELGSYPKVRAWVRRIETDLKLEHLA